MATFFYFAYGDVSRIFPYISASSAFILSNATVIWYWGELNRPDSTVKKIQICKTYINPNKFYNPEVFAI